MTGRRAHTSRRAGRPRSYPDALACRGGCGCARHRGTQALEADGSHFMARLREIAPDCIPIVAYGALTAARHSTSRSSAGSTCTSRCCRPGAELLRCSGRSWPATRSPAPRCSAWSRSSTPARPRHDHGAIRDDDSHTICLHASPNGAASRSSTSSTTSRTGISAIPQPDENVSYAPKLTTEEARIDWHRSALQSTGTSAAARPR